MSQLRETIARNKKIFLPKPFFRAANMSNDINGPDTSVTAVNTPAKKKKKHTNVNNVR